MSSTLKTILSALGVIILSEVLMGLGKAAYKKYHIMERKIALKVFFLFLFGLLFVVQAGVYLAVDTSTNGLTVTNAIIFLIGLALGVLLLVLLVRLVVLQPAPKPLTAIGGGVIEQPPTSRVLQVPEPPKSVNRIWVWIFTLGGLLLTGACLYIYIAYGPQHDPPGMTAEHQQIDAVLTYLCASAAIIGLVIFGAGVRKLSRVDKLPSGTGINRPNE